MLDFEISHIKRVERHLKERFDKDGLADPRLNESAYATLTEWFLATKAYDERFATEIVRVMNTK